MHAWLLAGLLAAPTAVDERVDVRWEGTGACRDETTLRDRVQRYLYPDSELAKISAVLRTVGDPPTIDAELTITSDTGESSRALHASSCEELVDAVAVVVAMTLDPTLDLSAVTEPEEPEPEAPEPKEPDATLPEPTRGEPDAPSPEPTPAPPPPDPAPQDPPRSQRRLEIAGVGELAGGVSGGRIPAPSARLGVAGGIRIGPWRILATHRYELPRARAVEDGEIVLWSWALGLRGCYGLRRGRFDIAGCVVFDAGQVRGAGNGLPTTARAARPWIGIGPRVALHVGLAGRWSAFAAFEGHAHALRPRFHIDGLGEVFETRTIGGSATAGVAIGLW